MSFNKYREIIGIVWLSLVTLLLCRPPALTGTEIYIYRRFDPRENLLAQKKVIMHGELFGQVLYPSSFPSYNDLSGPTDRWTYGFHDYILISPTTLIHGQLVTHDNGGERTKFDWHFSLRQQVISHLTLDIGHDSDHDSDHTSMLSGKPFYTNRNYFGVYLPWQGEKYFIEPFLRFFHHSNLRTHLDLSGDKIEQELGLRGGADLGKVVSLSFQVIMQSSGRLGRSEDWLGDLIIRFRLTGWLEASWGAGFWSDLVTSPLGNKQTFSKLSWGIAIPF
jgi:hypothetical protein